MKISAFSALLSVSLITIQTSSGAVTLTATEDNNVLRSAATTVQNSSGTASTFAIKETTDGQTNSRIGYLKFDLTGVSPSEGVNATFSVTLASSAGTSFNLRTYALDSGASGFGWTEGGITWNNRPGFSSSATGNFVDPATTTLVSSDVPVSNGTSAGVTISFDVLNWNNFRQSDESLTLILLARSQSNQNPSLSINSSEATTASLRPQLSIPEPSSAILVAIGSLLMWTRRK